MGRRSPGEREGSSHAALLIRTSCGQPQCCSLETHKCRHTHRNLALKPFDTAVLITSYLMLGRAALQKKASPGGCKSERFMQLESLVQRLAKLGGESGFLLVQLNVLPRVHIEVNPKTFQYIK